MPRAKVPQQGCKDRSRRGRGPHNLGVIGLSRPKSRRPQPVDTTQRQQMMQRSTLAHSPDAGTCRIGAVCRKPAAPRGAAAASAWPPLLLKLPPSAWGRPLPKRKPLDKESLESLDCRILRERCRSPGCACGIRGVAQHRLHDATERPGIEAICANHRSRTHVDYGGHVEKLIQIPCYTNDRHTRSERLVAGRAPAIADDETGTARGLSTW